MNNESSLVPIRLSSRLTKFSKVFILLFGIPVALVIPTETNYAVWAIAIAVFLIGLCFYFSKMTADAYLTRDGIKFEKIFVKPQEIIFSEVEKITRFNARRHEYFYFSTKRGSFLIIAPVFAAGKKALVELYVKNNKLAP